MTARGRGLEGFAPGHLASDRTEAGFPADLLPGAAELDLGVEDLWLAWELARMVRPVEPERLRALTLLVLASWARLHEGSTRLDLDGGPEALAEALGAPAEDRAALARLASSLAAGEIPPGLEAVVGRGDDPRPLILEGGRLYHQRMRALEGAVARDLAERLWGAPPALGAVGPALDDVLARPAAGVALSDEQTEAVARSLEGALTVITGGPGTGKTSIVVSILRVVARLDPDLVSRTALAAPTGKAADRMRRAVESALRRVDSPAPADLRLLEACPEAATLHRLLGYAPSSDRFRHHRGRPLPAELVIVDEASMIDLSLAGRLGEALPAGARLVLLGDADQLPSVDAGSVLADLVSLPDTDRVVRLTRSYRMREADPAGRAILGTAAAVRAGDEEDGDLAGWLKASGEKVAFLAAPPAPSFEGVGLLTGAGDREAFLETWLHAWVRGARDGSPAWGELVRPVGWDADGPAAEDAARLGALVARHESLRILCVTRVEPGAGSVAINRWFRARLGGGAGTGFLPGEPVIVTRNDYGRSLFNGDTGVVVRAAGGPGGLLAVFPRGEGFAAHPVEGLRGLLEPAWAVTVHKAQGSEYDDVALVLPEGEVRPFTREIVYTAVTRARRSVTIVGALDRLLGGAARRVRRSSGLVEALLSAAPPRAASADRRGA